jgi:hypothetical protein
LKEQVLPQGKVLPRVPLEDVPTDEKPRHIAENTIQVQRDEVLTQSQEAGKKDECHLYGNAGNFEWTML